MSFAVGSARYEGKPFLRVLELYVLDAIGHLTSESRDNLVAMTPKLRTIYRADGEWDEIVATVMDLPATMPSLIRQSWARNLEIAKENNVTLEPQRFAEMFVDANFL